jgi:hypothetical protein
MSRRLRQQSSTTHNGVKRSPVKHVINGIVIEEDVEPFPVEHQQLLMPHEELIGSKNGVSVYREEGFLTRCKSRLMLGPS